MSRSHFIFIAIILHASPLLSAPPISPVKTQSDPNEIVIKAKRYSPVHDVKPDQLISGDDVTATNSNTVNDVITYIRRAAGGDLGNIIVNGQRVSDISSVVKLPSGAIDHIEILPSVAAGRIGLNARDRVVNIVLKSKYHEIKIEPSALLSSGAEDKTAIFTGNYVTISGARRASVSIDANITSGIERENNDKINGDTSISLLPKNTIVTANSEWANTFQGTPYSITANAILDRSARLSSDKAEKRESRTIGIGATTSTYVSKVYISFITTVIHSHISANSGYGFSGTSLFTSTRTKFENTAWTTTILASGSVQNVAAGPISLSGSASRSSSWAQGSQDVAMAGLNVHQSINSIQGSIDVPITPHLTGLWSIVGDIAAGVSGSLSGYTQGGASSGHGFTVRAQPFKHLRLVAAFYHDKKLPSAPELAAPELINYNVPIFDPINSRTVTVTTITGGKRPYIPQSTSTFTLRGQVDLSKTVKGSYLNVEYQAQTSANPMIDLLGASKAVQDYFPNRFIRDSSGLLVSIDGRPGFAGSIKQKRLILSYQAGGSLRSGINKSPYLGWIFSLTDTVSLSSLEILKAGSPPIDLLRQSMTIGASTGGRHFVTWQLGLNKNRTAALLNGSWRSSSHFETLTRDGQTNVRQTQPLLFDVSLSQRLQWQRAVDTTKGITARLSLVNILNRRVKFDTDGAFPAVFPDPRIIDPLGRQIKVSVSKSF